MRTPIETFAAKLYYLVVAVLLFWSWSAMEGTWAERAFATLLISPLIVFASALLAPVISLVALVGAAAAALGRAVSRLAVAWRAARSAPR